MSNNCFVLALTGASGSAYAVRLAQVMLRAGCQLHIVVSDAARLVAARELGVELPTEMASSDDWRSFLTTAFAHTPADGWNFRAVSFDTRSVVHCHSVKNYAAGIASGSFLTRGMVVCPCSTGTLSAIACGTSTNLIQRAADVHLKERRPLVVVPRETPLSLIALENMTRLTRAGATVMPAMPGFYQQPAAIADLVDFVVARICDHLSIEHQLIARWGDQSSAH